jgi:hypothetical protein
VNAALLAAVALLGAAAMPPALAPLFDPAGETVEATTPVPSPAQRVGDVRLLRRGATAVVQTVLDTNLLPRVVAEIAKKERANWPAGRPGHDDAMRYVAAVEHVAEELRAQRPKDARRTRQRLHLLIEFALAESQAAVAISGWQRDDAGVVRRRGPLVVLEPSREYVRTNMRLITDDAFGRSGVGIP